MISRLVSDEALNRPSQPGMEADGLTRRLLPSLNQDRQDRAQAWAEWQATDGEAALVRYVRARNNTRETDDDIVQETLITAYLGVERGMYQPREGVPFTAYVIGVARNKIREARRRGKRLIDLDDDTGLELRLEGELPRQPERSLENREKRELLRGGLSRLPAARRQVLERYLIGESTDEIARRLSMSEALVRQHKCRGLRSLQRTLQASLAA